MICSSPWPMMLINEEAFSPLVPLKKKKKKKKKKKRRETWFWISCKILKH